MYIIKSFEKEREKLLNRQHYTHTSPWIWWEGPMVKLMGGASMARIGGLLGNVSPSFSLGSNLSNQWLPCIFCISISPFRFFMAATNWLQNQRGYLIKATPSLKAIWKLGEGNLLTASSSRSERRKSPNNTQLCTQLFIMDSMDSQYSPFLVGFSFGRCI